MGAKLHLTEKILEFISSGVVLAFTRDKSQRRQMHALCDEVWYEIDRKQLYQTLDRLHMKGLVKIIKSNDGIEQIALTRPAATKSLKTRMKTLLVKTPRKWDKKWRMVMFDIPEEKKKMRDAFRRKLSEMGFIEFQKSVFVFPYPCRDEINFVINFLNIAEYAFYIKSQIQPDAELRKQFDIK